MPAEYNYYYLIRGVILILAIFAVYNAKGKATLLLIITSIISAYSFVNFGNFQLPLKEKIHYWDAYHYYAGAKYFKELGYSGLYNATYVAGKEKGYFNEVSSVRELNTYSVIPVKLIDPEKVKARFTPERWTAFSSDLDYFYTESKRPDSAWEKLMLDHGYNAPPLKSSVMGFILNLFPLNNTSLTILVMADYFFVLAVVAIIAWQFNIYSACIFLIAFCLNPISPFDFTFGSVMRYDWFLFLGAGLCCLLKDKFKTAGVLFALSAQFRIFPLFFALGIMLTLSKRPKELFKFSGSFLFTCIVGIIISLIYFPDTIIYSDFISKMGLHHDNIFSNTVGIISLTGGRKLLANIFGAILALISILLTLGKKPVCGFSCGTALVFFLANPVNYYYSFLALQTLEAGIFPLLTIFLLGQIAAYIEPNWWIQSIIFSFLVFAYLILHAIKSQKGKVEVPVP
jgi:hypothetical protein